MKLKVSYQKIATLDFSFDEPLDPDEIVCPRNLTLSVLGVIGEFYPNFIEAEVKSDISSFTVKVPIDEEAIPTDEFLQELQRIKKEVRQFRAEMSEWYKLDEKLGTEHIPHGDYHSKARELDQSSPILYFLRNYASVNLAPYEGRFYSRDGEDFELYTNADGSYTKALVPEISYEPHSVFRNAQVGVALRGEVPVRVYDSELVVEGFQREFMDSMEERDGFSSEEIAYDNAVEWVWFNTIGAYVGESTPLIVAKWTDNEDEEGPIVFIDARKWVVLNPFNDFPGL